MLSTYRARDGTVVRVLPLPPMWPCFKSRHQRHKWVEFVVGSLLCSKLFFSRYSGFPLYPKNHHFEIPIQPGKVDKEPLCRWKSKVCKPPKSWCIACAVCAKKKTFRLMCTYMLQVKFDFKLILI